MPKFGRERLPTGAAVDPGVDIRDRTGMA